MRREGNGEKKEGTRKKVKHMTPAQRVPSMTKISGLAFFSQDHGKRGGRKEGDQEKILISFSLE